MQSVRHIDLQLGLTIYDPDFVNQQSVHTVPMRLRI